MQRSVTVVLDELLDVYKSNKLITRSTKTMIGKTSTLLNMAQGMNNVSIKVNQDFPLQCLPSIIMNVQEFKGLLPRA